VARGEEVAVTDWAPATDAEIAMRDALRAGDQELYFRILSRSELLLPVSADAIAGRAPAGWGTWTWGQRTHVLAFTSTAAMQACLTEHPGSARKVPYHDLAASWPNLEWWLAVNPGLPIEGYLPAWFVSQLARGELRLPGRTMGQRSRLERTEALARARAAVPPWSREQRSRAVSAPPTPSALSAPPTPASGAAHGVPQPVSVPAQQAAGVQHAAARNAVPGVAAPRTAALPTRSASPPPPSAGASAASGSSGPYPPATPAGPYTAAVPEPRAAPSAGEPGAGPAAAPGPAAVPGPPDFQPANDVEADLFAAGTSGDTDAFLSTLLLAKVLLPVAEGADPAARPGDPAFAWHTEKIDDEPYVVVFTSSERLADHLDPAPRTITVRFMQLIRAWPDESWSFAVNPSTPVGATLPGTQVTALASWAAEVGLGDDAGEAGEAGASASTAQRREAERSEQVRPTVMQKAIASSQVTWYLERGYDRVSGFVHRANEVAHLHTPAELVKGLGLAWAGSPFQSDADEVYVLRWLAYRPSLYRIPYGGQTEAGMRAMEGWVIERPPFRGNGFAPGDSGDVIAEFKVDSARLPHGAQLWRLRADGGSELMALLDADGPSWRRVEAT
jgi:hypothetical protein